MDEGGYFGYDDPDLDDKIDHDDDDDDESDQEVDTTRPFQPGAASTPYHGGEQHEMQTMQHEQSGLPDTSYEETPLLGAQSEKQKSWDVLTRLFPKASATSLETSYSKTGRLQVKIFGVGKKNYTLFTKDKSTGYEHLNPSLTKEILNSLGPSAEEIIVEDRDTVKEDRQRLAESERQLREAEKIAAEKEKEKQEIEILRQKLDQINSRIDYLQMEHGSNLESEAELKSLMQQKKNYKTELENKKKRNCCPSENSKK